jgi:pilus assembly protein CpaF
MFGKKGNATLSNNPVPKPAAQENGVSAPSSKPAAAKPAEQVKPEIKKTEINTPENKNSGSPKPEHEKSHDPFADEDAHAKTVDAPKVSEADEMTSLRLQRARNRIWLDLRDGIDLKALARMDGKAARDEVYSAVEEIARFRNLDVTPTELQAISKECGDDMLGFGPLEELLAIDGIADIMINGPETVYIELKGKISKSKGLYQIISPYSV